MQVLGEVVDPGPRPHPAAQRAGTTMALAVLPVCPVLAALLAHALLEPRSARAVARRGSSRA
ncbi:MAG: hypothetical protein K0S40_3754 [Actinomycetospora sp.]|nr:hypothetical protein [Actinomycetospora sp.]